jgi:hypothetical protein
MANEEIKKKEAEALLKALSLGTLRDDTRRIEGSHRNPRWKRPGKKLQRNAK